MALSVGSLGLRLEAGGASLGWPRLTPSGPLSLGAEARIGKAEVGPGGYCPWIGPAMAARSNREATNDELRTGSD